MAQSAKRMVKKRYALRSLRYGVDPKLKFVIYFTRLPTTGLLQF